ncbi:hypothetical protein Q6348_06390 [Isoptericola sp. b441]|uniref:DUF4190 domain-containing protein n=1 Tax=Actinotalea lenta TaxID=3064654 RepID=A0ABT9D990_9CELL|nr:MULTISPECIES: hypothetical protein [unclassified Isoptericola]MDO8106824.1 hypothetical protein [Isoptericola sp. b441]MDO8121465.1 hypothetical protein [Isoptericola sp. b490]
MITGRHELLERYLADLERRLAAADPGERADILASVREHVESELAMLDRPATSADVAAALESLGSVDTVAAAWTPEDGGATAAPGRAHPAGLAVAAGVLAALSVLLIWLPPVAGSLGVVALVLGIVALRRRDEPRWAALTGVVVGATTVVLGLVVLLGALVVFAPHSETGRTTDGVSVPAVSPAP